jgi:NhaP-type Na+/H+ or K+/H+ antiporter
MRNLELVLFLLLVATALARLADRYRVPYPALLMLAGMALGLTPGLAHLALAPDVVFLVFLPLLLYAAAWNTSWPDFKAVRRPIGLLALGCVLLTMTLVAAMAHYLVPGFTWATAFVLGALVSPPDAVAAAAALKGLPVPKTLTAILEGESLVNDATGLTVYRYAVAAVLTGQSALTPISLRCTRSAPQCRWMRMLPRPGWSDNGPLDAGEGGAIGSLKGVEKRPVSSQIFG